MNIKRKFNLIDFMMFFCMLFIGSDIISIRVSGITIRVVQGLLYLTTIIFILIKKYRFTQIVSSILFLISNLLSTLISYDQRSSILYVMWTVFNYFFVFLLFYSWAINRENKYIYELWRKTFLIQGFMIILQFLLSLIGVNILNSQRYFGVPRPALWFYEPSYLATYFIVFFTISMFMYMNTQAKKYRNDTILATIFIGFITSSSGFIGIVISIIICTVLVRQKLIKKVKAIIKSLLIFAISGAGIYIIYPAIFNIFIGRLFKDGLIISSGNRMEEWDNAWKVFINHKILGIGPDSYEKYTGSIIPPTNVTLELLCYLGVIGFITFTIFITSIIIKAKRKLINCEGENKLIGYSIIISFIVFIMVLQFNQNYLRLYMWMHIGIIAGLCNKRKCKSLV